jgi:hypothetical protein
MGDPNQGGGGMRRVELKFSFKYFVQMLSYIAMEMPKTAFVQPIDNKYEKTLFPRPTIYGGKSYSYLFVR